MGYIERKIKTTYSHQQTTPATEWIITHNLGRLPIVDAFINIDGVVQLKLPKDVIVVSENQCKLVFLTAVSGTAEVF